MKVFDLGISFSNKFIDTTSTVDTFPEIVEYLIYLLESVRKLSVAYLGVALFEALILVSEILLRFTFEEEKTGAQNDS